MRYGLPYQGSKNKLAKRIVDLLPPAKHLYDVFAGGCAVSHAALLSGKFACVHFSDTNDVVTLFRDALEGNIPDGSEWISREEFLKRKDISPYVRIVWSFGNNQRNYLYSRELEPYKKAVHEMIFAPTPNDRRLKFREVCRFVPALLRKKGAGCLANNESAERSSSLCADFNKRRHPPRLPESVFNAQAMEAAERCCGIASLTDCKQRKGGSDLNTPFCLGEYEMEVADYRDIDILPNSVIYADPPYAGTGKFIKQDFDHASFYDWCERQTHPLFISEYWMPEDRFACIAEFGRKSTFSPTNNKLNVIEKIYRPKKQLYEQI